MCGTVLVYLILLTPAIGSLVGLRSKICCHLAWWKVSKRTVMRFGTWLIFTIGGMSGSIAGALDLINMTGGAPRVRDLSGWVRLRSSVPPSGGLRPKKGLSGT